MGPPREGGGPEFFRVMGPPDFQGEGTIPSLGIQVARVSGLTANHRPCCASTRSVAQEGAVSFRELTMIEIREVIRRWLAQQGLRETAREVGLDRKTVRRYFAALDELGVARDSTLDDTLVQSVGASV